MPSSILPYLDRLTQALQAAFGPRLCYVGLQGSYARGEATAESDIDVMVLLEDLTAADLARYRQILEEVGDFHRSCGFLCGRAQMAAWNPLELCHLLHTTTDHYGALAPFLPSYTRQDVVHYVQLSLGNLYHELCHRRVHGDLGELAAALPQLYKPVFFLLQNLHYLSTGDFLPTKQALLAQLERETDRQILSRSLRLAQGAPLPWEESFARLFTWCQDTLAGLEGADL